MNVKTVRLADVCSIKYGKDHKKLCDGTIPAFGSGGVMRYVNQAISEKPSVLIPRKGSLSNLFYVMWGLKSGPLGLLKKDENAQRVVS